MSEHHALSMSDQVTLLPVSEDDLPVLHKLTQDPQTTGEFEWAGWFDPQMWRRGWDENGLIGPDGGTLMVIRGEHTTAPAVLVVAGYC
jgi:hypothetical protein